MTIRRALTLIAASTSLIAAGVAGGGTATASAAGAIGDGAAGAAAATLTITPTEENNNQWYVTVSGTSSAVYPSGFNAVFRLWGEDWQFDDLRAGPDTSFFSPFSTSFGYTWRVGGGELNEDGEGRDELYAGVRLYDPATGREREKAETNRVYGHWR